MLDEDHRKRLQRARTEPMNHWIESEDPVVIKVENESSGNIHTVIPDAMDCSCSDSTYRDFIDKHMIHLLLQDDEAGQMMRDALKAHQQNLKDRHEEILQEKRQLRNEIGTVRELIDVASTSDNESRQEEVIEEFQELTEDLVHQS